MEFKWRKMIIALGVTVFLISFIPRLLFSRPDLTSGFEKKEILFLKWGNGDGEIGLRKIGGYVLKSLVSKSPTKKEIKDLKEANKQIELEYERNKMTGVKPHYSTTFSFGIDAEKNIYIMDRINHRIKVFNQNGELKRNINADELINEIYVGNDGDIYFAEAPKQFKRSKDLGKFKIVRITKDNKQVKYEGMLLGPIIGNTIYDSEGKSLLVMKDKKDSGANKIPCLFRGQDVNIDRNKKKTISVKAKKINAYLKSLNKNSNFKDLEIPYIKKGALTACAEVLGLDKRGDIYIWYGYGSPRYGLREEKVYVYSPGGDLRTIIPIKVNELGIDEESPMLIKLSPDGELYQMWQSVNGIHVYKWGSK